MNLLYIAPMFHTNQYPIIKGWLDSGHTVSFVSHYAGKTENHKYLAPHIMGYSTLFIFLNFLYSLLFYKQLKHASYPEAFRDKCGFPPLWKLYKYVKNKHPDLVIIRERSIYSIFVTFTCRILHIPAILYNQTALWDTIPPKTDIAHRIVNSLTPSIRITPVLGDINTGFLYPSSYYIPFVIEPHLSPLEKNYFINNKITILCVAKYENRKNQLMLLETLSRYTDSIPFQLIFVGEVSTQHHTEYYEKLNKKIHNYNMETCVRCYSNCTPGEMKQFYEYADVFVLPSSAECASVSQLEAMSYSIPVIVSNTNGTSCYVNDGLNGFLFRDNSQPDLEDKLIRLLSNRELILNMGAKSFELVQTKYSFDSYYQKIQEIFQLVSPLRKD